MWFHLKQTRTWLGQALALGLFGGRFLSEQWSVAAGNGLTLPVAVILTLVTITLSILLFRQRAPAVTWPALLLLLYVFYPEPDPKVALLVALLVVTATWQVAWGRMSEWTSRVNIEGSVLTGAGGWLLAAGFFVLYLATLAPDVLPADSGELQLVAANLGVAHPPGFPLYTILGHLMTRLPLNATPAYKVNLLSTVTSALTLALVYLSTYRLGKNRLAAVTAAVALGTSTTFWAQATTTNVRSLTALFAALAIYALVNFTRSPSNHYLLLFALALGFGLGHHLSLGFMGLIFGLLVLAVDPSLARRPQRWLRPLLAGLLGLLPFLYLPLRAYADVRGAQPDLATTEGFINHALALGFQGDFFYFSEPAVVWQRLKVMGNVMTFQFSPWLLLGMATGLALLLWRERRLALLLGGSFTIHTFVTATYRAPQTVEYMMPAYVPAAICLGYGISMLAKWRENTIVTAAGQTFAAVMLVAALVQGFRHFPSYRMLHRDTTARAYTQTLLSQAPADAIILADWHWSTPLWYLQEVEGQRPDVHVRFVAPGGEAYAETWAGLIAQHYADGHDIVATHFDEQAYANLPTPEPLGEAFLFRQKPRTTLPKGFITHDLILGDQIRILGYRLESPIAEIGQQTMLTLAWQLIGDVPPDSDRSPVPIFAHLIDAGGQLYAQDDLRILPQPEGITLSQFRLTPRLGTMPGEYEIVLGIARPDRVTRTPIAHLTITPMSHSPVTQNPTHRPVAGTRPLRRLIGYDWDRTLPGQQRLYLHWQTEQGYWTEVQDDQAATLTALPAWLGPWGMVGERRPVDPGELSSHYVPLGQGIVWVGEPFADRHSPIPGRTISLSQRFISSQPVMRDLVVSVRVIGYEADEVHWAWWDQDDSIPAMGAIPTLKWGNGSRIQSPHFVTISPAAPPGQRVEATLRLYDAFTNRLLPVLDERITAQYSWVPLGQKVVGNP